MYAATSSINALFCVQHIYIKDGCWENVGCGGAYHKCSGSMLLVLFKKICIHEGQKLWDYIGFSSSIKLCLSISSLGMWVYVTLSLVKVSQNKNTSSYNMRMQQTISISLSIMLGDWAQYLQLLIFILVSNWNAAKLCCIVKRRNVHDLL